MAKITIQNLKGEKVGELELSDKVFGLPANDKLVHQVFVSMSGNRRQVIAHAKDRGERTGSGRKPWKQKGTGRARSGSVRSPLWRGGGVTFGPTKDRNFKTKINKKVNQKAIMTVLSGKVADNSLIVLDELALSDKKTKQAAAGLKKLGMKGNILIGFSEKEQDFRLYFRNIEGVSSLPVDGLNVFDMLSRKNLIVSKDSVKYLEKKYSKEEIN
ncbi:MAG: large subunit ribosomal protein L4 [Parcubacteria group bacterium Athens0714_25]|nr:MAG: large subunit ribosomal protein L4 [Parcubacteria group bacterium Athens0714_25]